VAFEAPELTPGRLFFSPPRRRPPVSPGRVRPTPGAVPRLSPRPRP